MLKYTQMKILAQYPACPPFRKRIKLSETSAIYVTLLGNAFLERGLSHHYNGVVMIPVIDLGCNNTHRLYIPHPLERFATRYGRGSMSVKHCNWSTSSLALSSETWSLLAYTCLEISPTLFRILTPPPGVQASKQVTALQSCEQPQPVLSLKETNHF